MSHDGFEFTYAMEGRERAALLRQAAADLDADEGERSSGAASGVSALGNELRTLAEDRAEFADQPEVYHVTTKALADGKPTQVGLAELTDKFDFYLIRFSIGLMSKLNWAFNMIEAKIEFNLGGVPGTRPKAFSIFPRKEFEDLLKGQGGMKVSITEKGELGARLAVPEVTADLAALKAEAKLAAGGELTLGLEVPEFKWSFKRARIEHSGTGLSWVAWRIRDGRFFSGDSLPLMVIAQVPKGGTEFRIKAEMQAYRYFNYLDASVQAVVARLRDKLLREQFENDLPLYEARDYNIGKDLARHDYRQRT